MPDGKEILDELSFEATIKGMDDRHLLEYTARKTFDICSRIQTLEIAHKKTAGIVGAITGGVASIIIAVIAYFTKKV